MLNLPSSHFPADPLYKIFCCLLPLCQGASDTEDEKSAPTVKFSDYVTKIHKRMI